MWEQDERLKCAGMQSTQQDEDEETAGLMCVEATEFEFNSGFKELWEDREIDIYYCITLFFGRDGSIFLQVHRCLMITWV